MRYIVLAGSGCQFLSNDGEDGWTNDPIAEMPEDREFNRGDIVVDPTEENTAGTPQDFRPLAAVLHNDYVFHGDSVPFPAAEYIIVGAYNVVPFDEIREQLAESVERVSKRYNISRVRALKTLQPDWNKETVKHWLEQTFKNNGAGPRR